VVLEDDLPQAVLDGRLPRLQAPEAAVDDHHADDSAGHDEHAVDHQHAIDHQHPVDHQHTVDDEHAVHDVDPHDDDQEVSPEGSVGDALERLDEITRRLRVECPWDREQDERTIVPHTLEEAYELADAAHRRDDAKLLDELGDVLFQVHFLSLLLEERGAGDLVQVADHCREKLIRRHPHVFGETRAETANEVRTNWDAIKQTEPGREAGIFGEVPENLPAPLYARKVQRRAASSGFDFEGIGPVLDAAREELSELERAQTPDELFHELGDVLFAVVNVARKLTVDPELALRASADRFRRRVSAGADLAASEGRSWNDLAPDDQLAYYARARMNEGDHTER
jgi:XTP/dITP diphosphohydrolase/tetrapyrrole methylase family protein/MazG family protein/ATP diphosphatase